MELNDIYDENRNLTGKLHRRGTPWKPGEYGVVVCVWVYDGRGHLLLTRRAREKSFAGTWENSGGAVKAGETSRQAIARTISSTIRSAAAGRASASRRRLISASASRSASSSSARGMARVRHSASGITTAAPLRSSARAFFVWWSSATLGEGTKTTGFATRQSSETVPAPLRDTTRSAAA